MTAPTKRPAALDDLLGFIESELTAPTETPSLATEQARLWVGDELPEVIVRHESGRVSIAGAETSLTVMQAGPSAWVVCHDNQGEVGRSGSKKGAATEAREFASRVGWPS